MPQLVRLSDWIKKEFSDFKTKRGRNFFKKRDRTLYVTKRNYAVKQSITVMYWVR